MLIRLSPTYGGLAEVGYFNNEQQEAVAQNSYSMDIPAITSSIHDALNFYRGRSNGTVEFVQADLAALPPEASIERAASAVMKVKYFGRFAGILQIVALAPSEGTGISSGHMTSIEKFDYLPYDKNRNVSQMVPVDKTGIHTEAYLPLARIGVRTSSKGEKKYKREPKPYHGSLDLLGYTATRQAEPKPAEKKKLDPELVKTDKPKPLTVERIATLQGRHFEGLLQPANVTTSWVDLRGIYGVTVPESRRFAASSAYYNRTPSVQVFGMLQIFDPEMLNVAMRVKAQDPKDRNDRNLGFSLAA